jgi:hypothetical protein
MTAPQPADPREQERPVEFLVRTENLLPNDTPDEIRDQALATHPRAKK